MKLRAFREALTGTRLFLLDSVRDDHALCHNLQEFLTEPRGLSTNWDRRERAVFLPMK